MKFARLKKIAFMLRIIERRMRDDLSRFLKVHAAVSATTLIRNPKSSNGHLRCNPATWSCYSAISL